MLTRLMLRMIAVYLFTITMGNAIADIVGALR